jgi:hypothetical protein
MNCAAAKCPTLSSGRAACAFASIAERRSVSRIRRVGYYCIGFVLPLIRGQAQVVATDSTGADRLEVRINGQAVALAFVDSAPVRLDTARVIVKSGDNLKSLLRAHRIVPNAAAIARFYELNPTVHDADQLEIGSSIILPVVWRDPNAAESSAHRISVALLADTSYKEALREQARVIRELSDSLTVLTGRSVAATTLASNSYSITKGARTISESSIPLSRETLVELASSLALYEEQMETALGRTQNARHVALAGSHVATQVIEAAAATQAGENARTTIDLDVLDNRGASQDNVRVVYARPLYEQDASRRESLIKSARGRTKHTVGVGPWKMWVEDLDGNEVSLRRELIRVRPDPLQEVTLIVKR